MTDAVDGGFQSLLAGLSDAELDEVAAKADGIAARRGSGPAGSERRELVVYDQTQYEREKRTGLRRANGARKLKKLSNRHLDIITMHLQGASGEAIANKIGCTVVTVSRILNDPLARDLITTVYTDRQNEIDALAGAAIKAVREVLLGDYTPQRKMTAVDKFIKLKESIGKEEDGGKTAEDVVSHILNGIAVSGENVQINIGRDS